MITAFRHLPLAIKVPMLVALLMFAVSTLVSVQVLSRLADTQNRNLGDLADAYLDGLSSSLIPHVQRDDSWEVFDTLELSRTLYQGLKVRTAIVVRRDLSIVASTNPKRFQTEAILPAEVTRSEATLDRLSGSLILYQPETWLNRDLLFQGRAIGRIYAEIDISDLVQARKEVLVTLVVTNMLLTGLLAGLGWWLVHRMMRPMQALSVRLQRGTNGNLPLFSKTEIGDPTSEIGRLFGQYNAMALAVSEREALSSRLAEEERLASLGRLSSVIAHEINNPLGGLLNAVDTIKRHGDTASVRNVSVGLLERGLNSIREVVETTLAVYRPDRNPRPLRATDIEDFRLLIDGLAKRRNVNLDWTNCLKPSSVLPAGPIRQIVLNLVINAVNAVPMGGRVGLSIRSHENDVVIRVFDNGPGVPESAVQALTSEAPPKTPNAKDGIGLWMVNRLLSELGGEVHVSQPAGAGTDITLRIPTKGELETSDVA